MNISELELSVRTVNLLTKAGIESVEQFLTLERDVVKGWRGAGRRTWYEIRDTQEYLRGNSDEINRVIMAANMLNSTMSQWGGTNHRLVVMGGGLTVHVVEVLG